MSLRPRYSLLTLLVVSALIAGGVKWWRGPHWRTVTSPRTVSEEALLAGHLAHPEFKQLLGSVVKCQYLNTFAGPELQLIQGEPGMPYELNIEAETAYVRDSMGLHVPRPYLQVISVLFSLPEATNSREKIRRWFSLPQQQPTASSDANPAEYSAAKPWFPRCYFVSDQKRVYQSDFAALHIRVLPIQVSDIPEPRLRALIERELAAIPDPE